jgi:hypothetical protein
VRRCEVGGFARNGYNVFEATGAGASFVFAVDPAGNEPFQMGAGRSFDDAGIIFLPNGHSVVNDHPFLCAARPLGSTQAPCGLAGNVKVSVIVARVLRRRPRRLLRARVGQRPRRLRSLDSSSTPAAPRSRRRSTGPTSARPRGGRTSRPSCPTPT